MTDKEKIIAKKQTDFVSRRDNDDGMVTGTPGKKQMTGFMFFQVQWSLEVGRSTNVSKVSVMLMFNSVFTWEMVKGRLGHQWIMKKFANMTAKNMQ